MKILHHLNTTSQLCAQAQTNTLAARQANRRRQQIQDCKDNRGRRGDNRDLLNVGDLAGDDDERHRDGEALQEILDCARQEFGCAEAVHCSYTPGKENIFTLAFKSKDINRELD